MDEHSPGDFKGEPLDLRKGILCLAEPSAFDLMNNYFPREFGRKYPVADRAKGIYIWDSRGKRYVDAAGGAAVAGIGHGVPSVVSAVAAQMKRAGYVHSSQFISPPAIKLAGEIAKFAGTSFAKGRVYFCSGGSEAVETALKLVRFYHLENGDGGRTVLISRSLSYHGSTLGCLNIGGHPVRRRPYEGMLDGEGRFTARIPAPYCYRCPWKLKPDSCDVPCAEELGKAARAIGPERVAAFIGEPISGATFGAGVPSTLYWPRIREICDRFGFLLIADEVMTGMGRVGRNLALDLWGVSADVVTLGKGLAGGYAPLACALAKEPVWRAIASGSACFEHGFTFSAHPVACAAGLAVLREIVAGRLVQRAETLSAPFQAGLSRLKDRFPFIGDVRGAGLLWGIEFVADRSSKNPFPGSMKFAARVRDAAFKNGLIVYPGSGFVEGNEGDHILLAPPLTISLAQSQELFRLLETTLKGVARTLESRGRTGRGARS